ncbi:Alpha/Beta hydrolase protein [Geopyxis carbonaria]|nr:Alpha/Beta hydrolase protein [Geopyxis carbonaria]
MKSVLHLLRARRALSAPQRALEASSPSLPVASTDNSLGASRALSELSYYLDDVLAAGDVGAVQLRLATEAAKTGRTRLGDGCAALEVSREQAAVLQAAMACARAVYEPTSVPFPEVDGLAFSVTTWVAATVEGTTKETWVVEVQRTGVDDEDAKERLFPLLVVAVRGSASGVDWMVNANGDPRDASEFLDPDHLGHVSVHSGFLHGARALEGPVRTALAAAGAKHVVFAGHSAGGAVAALLFSHFLASSLDDSTRYSSITFGAPPLAAPDITPRLLQLQQARTNPGLVLAIVNDGDPVARADRAYLRTLVDLYRAACGAEPLPPPEKPLDGLCNVGTLVVVRDRNHDGDERDIVVEVAPRNVFEELVYCNAAVHRRVVYAESVELIARGCVNGRTGW